MHPAGLDSVRPPSLERETQSAFGVLPRPLSVTNDRYSVPSAAKATSGPKHLASSPFGAGIAVCRPRGAGVAGECSAHEKKGVSMRFATARFAGRAGLRTSVGELCASMSSALRADALTGASRPTRLTVGALVERARDEHADHAEQHEPHPSAKSNKPRRRWRSGLMSLSGDSPEMVSGESSAVFIYRRLGLRRRRRPAVASPPPARPTRPSPRTAIAAMMPLLSPPLSLAPAAAEASDGLAREVTPLQRSPVAVRCEIAGALLLAAERAGLLALPPCGLRCTLPAQWSL